MKTGRQDENEIHPLLQRKPTYFNSDQRTTTTQSFICIYSFYKMYIKKKKKKMCIWVWRLKYPERFPVSLCLKLLWRFQYLREYTELLREEKRCLRCIIEWRKPKQVLVRMLFRQEIKFQLFREVDGIEIINERGYCSLENSHCVSFCLFSRVGM